MDSYYIVDYDSFTNTPVRSFQVAIISKNEYKMKLSKPFKVMYKWTGKGFIAGVKFSKEIIDAPASDLGAPLVKLGIVVLIIPSGTAIGFLAGFLKSIAVTREEFEKPLINMEEILVGYNRFYYDDDSRIIKLIQFTPTEKPVELIRTIFKYHKKDKNSYKIIVYSKPDNKKRVIKIK